MQALNEVKAARLCGNRKGAHQHISGLGCAKVCVDEALDAGCDDACGLIGQHKARKAARVVLDLLKSNKSFNRAVLIAGAVGSGKTALAYAIAKELGADVPFVPISASEVYSPDVKPAEVLTQAMRRAVSVTVREEREVIEGEISEIVTSVAADGAKSGTVVLRTKDMESLYCLGPKLLALMERKNIIAGDVIRLDRQNGTVTRLGRSVARCAEYDAFAGDEQFVEVPSGELQRSVETEHRVTLHDIDIVNSRPEGFIALFDGNTGEVSHEVRQKVDAKVEEWVLETKASLELGVLFIDECHLLDVSCFAFLNRVLDTPYAPLLILASNKGVCPLRGTSLRFLHGIPPDFLDRLLAISTQPLGREELRGVLQQRAQLEEARCESAALELLVSIAADSSLRYALNLLTYAATAARRAKAERLDVEHVELCYRIFLDS
uniref:RuvB-like helicase n=1 Tax=Dermatophagoides pteronyssinus TaxID=6956 RepID=A0A6P6YL29_DERPT|nr:ruvB-like helicase 2 [Dermatophagoides pteronyssinus]